MKILIATDSFLPRWDGISRFLDEILPKFKGLEVTVVAPDFGKSPNYPVRVIKFPLRNITLAEYTPALVDKKKLKQLVKQTDLVFSQTIGPIGYNSLKYAKKYKKKSVSFIHSIEWHLFSKSLPLGQKIAAFFWKRIIPRIYKKSDLLICPSQETRRALQKKKIGKNYSIVHLGVDTKQFKPRKSTKNQFGLQDYTVIGYVGRTGREKDLNTLYKSFRELYEQDKSLHLLIVGGCVKWPDMRGITNVEKTDTPELYYNAMDVYVLPSHTETTSLTTLEAMASGVCVIATPVGHINIYLQDRKNGILFPPGDEEYLKVVLQETIYNKKLRERLSKAALLTVKEFNWDETAKELIKSLRG